MRKWAAIWLLMVAAQVHASRLILVPLDSRPAAGQFAQMIGNIADVDTRMPPYEMLGQFTKPGNPDQILDWLEEQDLSRVSAMIISADMIAYGGLIASRSGVVPLDVAVERMRRLLEIRNRSPQTKLYLFSSIMRLTPTATVKEAPYRLKLAKFEELKEHAHRTGAAIFIRQAEQLRKDIPPLVIVGYEATRRRNHALQTLLVKYTADGAFDYLVLGQDDAKPYGPHIPEQLALRQQVSDLNVGGKVYFCEGIDQHASVLVSRALLRESGWFPRIRVVYSDELGKSKYANFESKPIRDSLEDQIIASGARPVDPQGEYDYALYLNTPKPRNAQFSRFLDQLDRDLDGGRPVAVADINLGRDGTADTRLFNNLWDNRRAGKLLSFAGWNTAGNTMGTSIPAANVVLLARRMPINALVPEVARREFLLHRFVDDYAYHKFTRPLAYNLITTLPGARIEEFYGKNFDLIGNFVRRDVIRYLQDYFEHLFKGETLGKGDSQIVLTGLDDIKVWLPWPRAYEMRLQFHISATPVSPASGQ